jgi:hypothetical protein
MKKVLKTYTATIVGDLRDNLIEAVWEARLLDGQRHLSQEEVYVTINSDSIRVQLVEETLTDGSKVYNVELSEASK